MKPTLVLLTATLLAPPAALAAAENTATKPNVVLIVADDLGYGSLGCYGNKQVRTPQIDLLAADGMRFTDYHANSPYCSPTRAAMLTGRYPERCAWVDDPRLSPVYREQRQANLKQRFAWGLDPGEVTLPEVLRKAGYRTGLIGKWHLGYDHGFNPLGYGFDEFRGYIGGAVDYHTHRAEFGRREPDWWNGRKLEDEPGYATDLLTGYAVDFINRHRKRPFFLWLSYGAPHVPLQGRDPRAETSPSATYVEMIGTLDDGVGRVRQALRENGLEKDTLLVFCSDNGADHAHGIAANDPLSGFKGKLLEGGHRVPCIACWPARISAGSLCRQTVIGMDWFTTFAAMAGATLPNGFHLDGVDLVDVLTRRAELKDRALHWLLEDRWAVREGPWKLLGTGSQPRELYDLAEDLGETHNLLADRPEIVRKLQPKHEAWLGDAYAQRQQTPELKLALPQRSAAVYDLVVYGDSAAAVTAAVQARRLGLSVVLVNPARFLGGMTCSGLSASDINNRSAVGGIALELYRRIGRHYGKEYVDYFEPHVAQEQVDAIVAEANVPVEMNEQLDRKSGVKKDGQRITSITTLSGKTYRGRMFIDASYTGDLMAAAGVTFTVGRESNSQYGETINGAQRGDTVPRAHYTQRDKDHFIRKVDPYVKPGDPASGLLPYIFAVNPVNGEGDRRIQAYNYRLCLTDDPANRLPIEKPAGYREVDHELLLRNLEAGDHRFPALIHKLPNGKVDWNSMHAVGTDYVGANWDYPETDYETRRRMEKEHELYIRGHLWTLANHPRVPEAVRTQAASYGLCKDEFRDNGGWPPMIYIREARRMVGDYVMTEADCKAKRAPSDPVALASFGMDSHAVRYFVTAEGYVQRDGVIWQVPPRPYGVSYRSIVPRDGECENLLVPVCLSATHVAHGSIRMEPVFMGLGQAAAAAAAIAIQDRQAVQKIAYRKLRARLEADGLPVVWKPTAGATGTRPAKKAGSRARPPQPANRSKKRSLPNPGAEKIRLALPDGAEPAAANVGRLFARQVQERCEAKVVTTGDAPLTVELAILPGLGAEGFRIEDRPGGGVRIVGNDERGLLYGVGKLLRTSRYDQGGFTPGTWRGTSVPSCPIRGVYLATHFNNFYEAAPIDEVRSYLECPFHAHQAPEGEMTPPAATARARCAAMSDWPGWNCPWFRRQTSESRNRRDQGEIRMNKTATRSIQLALALVGMLLGDAALAAERSERSHDSLAKAFLTPPKDARPWCYWWWLNGAASKEGITRDFEEMRKQGIGGAILFDAGEAGGEAPRGPHFMSPAWRELFKHAIHEADRCGVVLTVNLCSGWNCGGPWVTPEHAAKKLVCAQTVVKGPGRVSVALPKPQAVQGLYRDIAVLASDQVAGEKASAASAGRRDSMLDLTQSVDQDGRLSWDAPAGNWRVLRIGYTLHGNATKCVGSGPVGLEIDTMSAEAMDAHFAETGAKLLADAGPLAGKTLQYFHIDSWELGQPTWTPKMREEFRRRRGYDPLKWLPAVLGQTVENADETRKFLQDYRRTAADLVAENYYGRLEELSIKGGLRGTHPESGGPFFTHWIDALQCMGRTAIPMGEFWRRNYEPGGDITHDHNPSLKQAASAAHIYGKPLCQAEAFTSMNACDWTGEPWIFKDIGDEAFCEGLTRNVLCFWVHQPKPDAKPGFQWAHVGTHFDCNITWWPMADGWLTYLARCQYILRQGLFVADIAYLQDEAIPGFISKRAEQQPARPAGFDYDVINAEVLLTRTSVKESRLALANGMSYRYLVLPHRPNAVISPATLRRINELAAAGVTVIGSKALAGSVTGMRDGALDAAVRSDGLPPDIEFRKVSSGARFDWIHRRSADAEFYFVANLAGVAATAEVVFRTAGKQPELWDAVSGEIRDLTEWRIEEGRTALPLVFAPRQSWFIVFRRPTQATGSRGPMNFPAIRTIAEIAGPWQVSFNPNWGGPEQVVFEKLDDWTARPEEGIKYYSGTAIYKKTLTLPRDAAPQGKSRLYLDLGVVKNVARVRLNGRDLGVVWTSPWRVEVTAAVRQGDNELEIEVANLWPNRLIGDAILPKERRLTTTNVRTYDTMASGTYGCKACAARKKSGRPASLLPSGLLGPVRLVAHD